MVYMIHLLAAGSTPGRLHLLSERPNQDAFHLASGGWGSVAVVCDGCGSEPKSQVGAVLGAAMAARSAARQLAASGSLDLERLRGEMLAGLSIIAGTAGISAQEHLLFTLVGVAMHAKGATVFACGDGVIAVDGTLQVLGPFPGNAPPYIGYGLLEPGPGFTLLHDGPAERVLIGTDGAAEADLKPFWTEDRMFRNPDLTRRRLKLLRLQDDATVAVIRSQP